MPSEGTEGMGNSVDPGQTVPDLGLRCLPRPKLSIITVLLFWAKANCFLSAAYQI